MRDIFEDIFTNQPVDPSDAARRAMRPGLRRRFYGAVSVESAEGAFQVRVDGLPVRTPAGRILAAPVQALADAIAAEWSAQQDVIDPGLMPLTRLANTIIDGVMEARAAVAAEVEKYLASDLLCYRADQPERLVARQAELWDPVLAWARDDLGARFILTEGVTFVQQPAGAIAAAASAIPRNPWRLGAVYAITSLTGSALAALAVASGALGVDAAWAAAHVDEDWNSALWGQDEIAVRRRAFRFGEMRAAGTVLALVPAEPPGASA